MSATAPSGRRGEARRAMTRPIIHDARIFPRNRGPLPRAFQFVCDCGAASPIAVDRFVAIIAKRSHLRGLGIKDPE